VIDAAATGPGVVRSGRPRRRHRTLITLQRLGVVLVAVLVVGTACSSDKGGSSEKGGSHSSSSTTARAQEPTTTVDTGPVPAAVLEECTRNLELYKSFRSGAVLTDEQLRKGATAVVDALRAGDRSADADAIDRLIQSGPTGGLDGFTAAAKWCEAHPGK
jgi:hypothetical protein